MKCLEVLFGEWTQKLSFTKGGGFTQDFFVVVRVQFEHSNGFQLHKKNVVKIQMEPLIDLYALSTYG